MIACICPGSSSADHSLNTLRYDLFLINNIIKLKRYADRLKDRTSGGQKLEKLDYKEDTNFFDDNEVKYNRPIDKIIPPVVNKNIPKQIVNEEAPISNRALKPLNSNNNPNNNVVANSNIMPLRR